MKMETEYKPEVPKEVRSSVYFAGLIVGFLVVLTIPIAAIWFPLYAVQIIATAAAISAAVGWVASALGVVYRPTANQGGPDNASTL